MSANSITTDHDATEAAKEAYRLSLRQGDDTAADAAYQKLRNEMALERLRSTRSI